jgi:hypothetical protein
LVVDVIMRRLLLLLLLLLLTAAVRVPCPVEAVARLCQLSAFALHRPLAP